MVILLGIFLLIALFFEGTVTTLPLLLVFLLLLAIRQRDGIVFILAFFVGIVLDSMRLQPIGGTSLFLLCFLFLVFLYERKYETSSLPFVVIASFLGAAAFSFIFASGSLLLQGLFAAILAAVVFIGETKLAPKI